MKEAAERRATEEKWRKARLEEERKQERLEAEQRQRQRVSQKKAQAEASKKNAAQRVRQLLERSQKNRSATFSAARGGDGEKVKNGVYVDEVDAAGGELKRGAEEFLEVPPKDPQETLLHIAADQGDLDLVEWLIRHSELHSY